MRVEPAGLAGVFVVTPPLHEDARGALREVWHRRRFEAAGLVADFVQDNHTTSRTDVLRGLHFQLGAPQAKLIRVTRGVIFDAVVDVRRSSPMFGRWTSTVLSAANGAMLWIPAGFAHGYYVLEGPADVAYKVSAAYDEALERTVRFDDPALGIAWPIVAGRAAILSARDAAAPLLADAGVWP